MKSLNKQVKPLLFIAALVLSSTSCIQTSNNEQGTKTDIFGNKKVEGIGELVEKKLELGAFSKIEIEGQADVTITHAEKQAVLVKAQENILELLDYRIENGTLILGTRNNYSISNSKGIFVEIATPNAITSYTISGAGKVIVSGKPQEILSIDIAGAAHIDAKQLEVDNVTINIAGSADCDVFAKQNLEVSIAGTGKVTYKGDPNVTKSIAGIGSVKKE